MLIATVITVCLGYYSIAIVFFILALFFANFFRNPKRVIPTDPDVILSPADGKIMEIADVYEDLYLHRECKKVTIFLSVFDVHANRAP
ncbi:phosphatidylserine decarboxylase, partial [Veillonella caviae]